MRQYYDHNEGIVYPAEGPVLLYDPEDRLIGEMSFQQAMVKAHEAKLDLVLRNRATEPATMRIMDFKREVFRKLLMRLGKRFSEGKAERGKCLTVIRIRRTQEIRGAERKHQIARPPQQN